MSDFWSNFFANLISSAIVAIAFYVAITKTAGKREEGELRKQSLGMLKTELEVNYERIKNHLKVIRQLKKTGLPSKERLRLTRGVWNALKENGFLLKIRDTRLVYFLLETNEAIVVADNSLLKLRNANPKDKTIPFLFERAEHDCTKVEKALKRVLPLFAKMNLPIYNIEELDDESINNKSTSKHEANS